MAIDNPPTYVVRIFGKTLLGEEYNGTGFIINSEGYVVTCWHVVEQAAEIWIKFPHNQPFIYDVYSQLAEEDIAILRGRVPIAVPFAHASLHTDWFDNTKVSDTVSFRGYSAATNFESAQNFICTISAFSEQYGLIGLSGNVNLGDSGGPLINEDGLVIGMVRCRDINRPGQAMAIPISMVTKVICEAGLAEKHTIAVSQNSMMPVASVPVSVQTQIRVLTSGLLPAANLDTLVVQLSRLDPPDLARLILKHMSRSEIAGIWFDLWETLLDDDLPNKSLTDCVAELVKRVRKRNRQSDLYKYLCRDWADLEDLTGSSSDTVPTPVLSGRSRFFTGRKDVLVKLFTILQESHIAALSGLGGLGKTQIAIQYVLDNGKKYTYVFWTAAETLDNLLLGYAQIARMLNLSQRNNNDQSVTAQAVLDWLEEHDGWLLVLDNADDISLIRSFIPTGETGHTILTTRAFAVNAVAEPIYLGQLSPEDGATLILRRSGALARNATLETASPEDQKAALTLSKELDGLPLALDQAGAYINEAQRTSTDYLKLYKKERAKVLKARGNLGSHPSVMMTYVLAFEKLVSESPAAADLLRLCAFLAPDPIPELILVKGAPHLGDLLSEAVNDFTRSDIIAAAAKYSLLTRDPQTETLLVHRLVQAVLQDTMTDEEKACWSERTILTIEETFPEIDFANWPLCDALLPHALSCSALILAANPESDLESPVSGRLLNQIKYYLYHRARYSESLSLFERTLAMCERVLGSDHPDTALGLNNLAELYRSQGDYALALPLSERSLAICARVLGSDHPDTATSLNNLAVLYANQGDYARALPLFERSLGIRERVLGSDHPDTASSLNILGMVYFSVQQYAKAEPLLLQALSIWEKALGPDHPNVALALENCAYLYDEMGQADKAAEYAKRAQECRARHEARNAKTEGDE